MTLDSVIFLSIFHLKKLGVLTPGSSTELTWNLGCTIIQRTKLFIDEDGVDMVGGKIYFDRTPCHFGGERLWFQCPKCNNRSGVLYGIDFVCRECSGLHYGCQYESELDRSQRKLKQFTHRAFGTASPWVKPKGQHGHTYLYNLGEYCELSKKQHDVYMKVIS